MKIAAQMSVLAALFYGLIAVLFNAIFGWRLNPLIVAGIVYVCSFVLILFFEGAYDKEEPW